MHLVMVPQIMPLFILLRVFYIRYQKMGSVSKIMVYRWQL